MIRLTWHLWRHGHSVTVIKHLDYYPGFLGRGWFYECECGRWIHV